MAAAKAAERKESGIAPMVEDLWRMPATKVVELLRLQKVTPLQLIDVAEERWKAVDTLVNAMPITCWDRAREQAKELMQAGYPADPPRGYLYGLPIVVKDSTPVKGLPFVMGSKMYVNRVSRDNDPLIDVLEGKGGIVVGKTNLPEMSAGGHTYNAVFGATGNPWDVALSAGGSSGGSAAALAAGFAWAATGSDMAGSLRTPCGFCGVVGIRPSVGLVPQRRVEAPAAPAPAAPAAAAGGEEKKEGAPAAAEIGPEAYLELWRLAVVQGPIARNVGDLALLLDSMAEEHPADPVSSPAPPIAFSDAIKPGTMPGPKNVAWTPDLGGVTAMDPEVAELAGLAAVWFQEEMGVHLVKDCPNLSAAPKIAHTIRSLAFRRMARLLQGPKRDMLGPDLVWQIEQGVALKPEELEEAVESHNDMLEEVRVFFDEYDLLLCPTTCTLPFPKEEHYPTLVGGREMQDYTQWLTLAATITLTGCCSVSVPCGYSSTGMPVGLLIVGPPGQDAAVVAAAAAFESANPFKLQVPRCIVHCPAASALTCDSTLDRGATFTLPEEDAVLSPSRSGQWDEPLSPTGRSQLSPWKSAGGMPLRTAFSEALEHLQTVDFSHLQQRSFVLTKKHQMSRLSRLASTTSSTGSVASADKERTLDNIAWMARRVGSEALQRAMSTAAELDHDIDSLLGSMGV